MAQYRSSTHAFPGFDPAKAKCARDKLLAEVDVELRAAGHTCHPQALLYATKADMDSLVASLPTGAPRMRLEQLGREGIALTTARKLFHGGAPDRGGTISNATEHYPGWSLGPPHDFWFTGFSECNKTAVPGVRVSADQASYIIRTVAKSKVDGRKLMASRAFCRGAGFEGHRKAVEHEAKLLERAASDKHAHATRLREKLQKFTETPRVSKGKSKSFLGAQIKSMQTMLQKTTDEATYYDRQVLIARRFIDQAPSQEEDPPRPPSPADSLHRRLAGDSQESSQESLPPHTVETLVSSASAQQLRTGGAASSRLDTANDPQDLGSDSARSQPASDRARREDARTPQRLNDSPDATLPSQFSASPLTAPPSSQARTTNSQAVATSQAQQPAAPARRRSLQKTPPPQRPVSQRQPTAPARTGNRQTTKTTNQRARR